MYVSTCAIIVSKKLVIRYFFVHIILVLIVLPNSILGVMPPIYYTILVKVDKFI